MGASFLKQNTYTVTVAHSGVIAAAYVGLTLLLQPMGFGVVQCRVAEALTVLPVYTPTAVSGLAVGCFLSNVIGLSTGANPLGGWDLLLGTVATLLSAVLTRLLRHVRVGGLPWAATLPPVLLNALVVGSELYAVYGGLPWVLQVLAVAVGQLVACTGGGLLVAAALEKGVLKQQK